MLFLLYFSREINKNAIYFHHKIYLPSYEMRLKFTYFLTFTKKTMYATYNISIRIMIAVLGLFNCGIGYNCRMRPCSTAECHLLCVPQTL